MGDKQRRRGLQLLLRQGLTAAFPAPRALIQPQLLLLLAVDCCSGSPDAGRQSAVQSAAAPAAPRADSCSSPAPEEVMEIPESHGIRDHCDRTVAVPMCHSESVESICMWNQ
ncbi:hypothetical protein UY3_04620 [Chelonia mydas]|uniref:Uncharacterized protein n=1 Tax=Chelonia mydas TaxID=8469 RepID=M7C1D1_CHEMY|nr:hypothetical protein UY3_04620 [Chelonia mydas]